MRSGRTVGVLREFSAGGVLVRVVRGRTMVAAIRPRGKREGLWALPKGQIDAGESAAETAVREVREETGVSGRLVEKLGDVRYVYAREGERIFKVVSFFLLRAGRGRIGEIEEEMRIEVAEARWLPLDEAPLLLAYGGERQMAAKALERLGA
jgi:8-oxo-dGTP pyrophosphatase MutT (NUDIX family)